MSTARVPRPPYPGLLALTGCLVASSLALSACSSSTPPGPASSASGTPTASTTGTSATTPPPTSTASSTSTRPQQAGPTPTGTTTPGPEGPTSLAVTPGSGGPGTTVTMTATGCPQPSSGYRALFADSDALAHPNDPALRHAATVLSYSGTTVHARYTVTTADSTGPGLLEVLCGGSGNATALFDVTG
ncbi:MAG: hypothetical protein ACYCXA_05810 [Actinomycetes bacterium]